MNEWTLYLSFLHLSFLACEQMMGSPILVPGFDDMMWFFLKRLKCLAGRIVQCAQKGVLLASSPCTCTWLILCVSSVGSWGVQTLSQTLLWVCLWGCFWVRFTFESAGWIKQMGLPHAGGPHCINWRPEENRRLTLPWIRGKSCLSACELRLWFFSCLQTWSDKPALLGSGTCSFQIGILASEWNYAAGSPGSPLPNADLGTSQSP